jgi:hypothetical protein
MCALFTVLPRTATLVVTGRRGWQIALREILRTVKVPGFIILKSSLPPKPFLVIFNNENVINPNQVGIGQNKPTLFQCHYFNY